MRSAFLLCVLVTTAAFAAPPELTIPPDLKPVQGYIRFTPTTTAKSVIYVSLDEAYPFPSEELKDSRRFVLPVQGLKNGTYRFVAVGSLNDEQTAKPFSIVIGGATPPPVEPPPPVDPPPVTGKRHFMIVRPSGVGISKPIEDLMNLPAWAEVKAAGHSYADLPFESLPESARARFATQPMPFLLTWDIVGKEIKLPAGATASPAPTTNEAIRGLLK